MAGKEDRDAASMVKQEDRRGNPGLAKIHRIIHIIKIIIKSTAPYVPL